MSEYERGSVRSRFAEHEDGWADHINTGHFSWHVRCTSFMMQNTARLKLVFLPCQVLGSLAEDAKDGKFTKQKLVLVRIMSAVLRVELDSKGSSRVESPVRNFLESEM